MARSSPGRLFLLRTAKMAVLMAKPAQMISNRVPIHLVATMYEKVTLAPLSIFLKKSYLKKGSLSCTRRVTRP